jgi:hypothetical protein
VTPVAPAPAPRAGHPLEDSDRLAWQATAAVDLLERFGDLLSVALEAVGSGDDAALQGALVERERLLVQLEPLLAALARARDGVARASGVGTHAHQALGAILRPVDEALRHAQLLHERLSDEVAERPATVARRAPVALVS